MNTGVYAIINLANGKIYIGGRQNIAKAISRHFKDLKERVHINRNFQRDFNFYGKEWFVYSFLEECERDEIHEREQWWLDNIDNKYNIAASAYGGHGYGVQTMKGKVVSEETRKKIGEKSTGRKHDEKTKQLIGERGRGRIPSEDTLRKRSESMKATLAKKRNSP